MQEALIRKDSRPVLLSAEVTDVVKQEDKTYAHFRELDSDEPNLLFILECNSEQTKVISANRDESAGFTVIAAVTSVRRANKNDVQDDSDLEDTYVANGSCLDLITFNSQTSSAPFIALTSMAFIVLLTITINIMMSND